MVYTHLTGERSQRRLKSNLEHYHSMTVLAEHRDCLRDQLPEGMRGLLKAHQADPDGLHTFMIWELLATFGASSGNGYPDVFEGG